MYKLGDEKGEILEKEIAKMDAPPKNALELGTFLGYSALRTARRLAPGGMLHCIGVCVCERARERGKQREWLFLAWRWCGYGRGHGRGHGRGRGRGHGRGRGCGHGRVCACPHLRDGMSVGSEPVNLLFLLTY